MNGRRILISFLILLLFILVSCSSAQEEDEISGRDPSISVEQAKNAAFSKCKVKASKASVTRRKLIYRSGQPYYMICFMTEQKKDRVRYECLVNADTGKVESTDKQVQIASRSALSNVGRSSGGTGKYIGVEKVKTAVILDAGLEHSAVAFDSVRLQNISDKMIYIAEFNCMGIYYMFEVDAVNGNVISREVEYED